MNKIIEAVEKFVAIANAHFYPDSRRSFNAPTVLFAKRGTTAGYATYQKNTVDFNMGIYRENVDKFLATTVPHEVAHIIAFQLMGEKGTGHGYWWKFVMTQVFKISADRCHSYEVEHHKTRKICKDWVYQCNCCTHNLTTIKHNKIQKGKTFYRCIKCNTRLIYIGESAALNKKAA